MLMNNNDFKYIFKRVLVFIIISIILFCFNSCKAKAETFSFTYNNNYNTGTFITNTNVYSLNMWNSVKTKTANKKGQLTFSIYQAPITSQAEFINSVSVHDSTNSFECSIGNVLFYNDNSNSRIISTIVCNVEFDSTGMQYIQIHRATSNDSLYILFSEHMTFSDSATDNVVVTNLNNIYNQIASEISQIQQFRVRTNEQLVDLYNLINGQQSSIVASINNQTTAINNQTTQIHEDSQAINNSINDTTPVSNNEISGNTSDWSNNNLQSGTITQLLTLPITLIQAYLNGINSSCSQFNLGSLFGSDLILPCINVSNYIGTALWSTIDILFSGFMILNISKKLIKIFNDFTNLNSNQADELYGGGA